ncbi:hypothetical protein [Arthrobacter sp. H20]|uniref:hypothetical protein n=1 Tax=Arthrobacter sp. H20 TaxID=1267981 RepID=UPI0004795091|nr:hypothetical protein [Arthrobacter sp. H20]
MANIERRSRKDGTTAHLLRWVDKKTGKRKTQRFDEAKDAEFMLTVLEAHDLDASLALSSAQKHFMGAYTVTKMVEDHIELRTNANGYTIQRHKGPRCRSSQATNGPCCSRTFPGSTVRSLISF